MQYFSQFKHRWRSSQIMTPPNPVLTAEDEAFLERVTSQPDSAKPAPGTARSQATESPAEDSHQRVLNGGSQDIPLPASRADELKELGEEERKAREKHTTEPAQLQSSGAPHKKKRWSAMFWRRNSHTKKVSPAIVCPHLASPVPILLFSYANKHGDVGQRSESI